MNLNSITDNPIQTTATYNKGETYETKYDDPVDDTETYKDNVSMDDLSIILSYPSIFDYSDVK